MNNKSYEELLGKAIKEATKDNISSLDFYKDIKYIEPDFIKYRSKKKAHTFRYITIAASLFLVFALSSIFAVLISNNSVSASKFEIQQQIVKLKNLFANEKENNYKENVNNDQIILEIKSQDEIKRAKEFFPGLYVFHKIPERFNLQSLTIYKQSNGIYKANYVYKDITGSLITINQESIPREGMSTSIINTSKEIKTKEGTIYIFEDPFGDGSNAGTYLTDNYIIDVSGMIQINEITDILN